MDAKEVEKSASMAPPSKKPRLMRRRSSVMIAQERVGAISSISRASSTAEEVASAEAACAMFDMHDADGNGVLDYDELRTLLHSLGSGHERLHPNYIEHFLRVADRDHKQHVTRSDFDRVYDRLQHFAELLQAPRRRVLASCEKPRELSKFARVASLVCPPIATTVLEFAQSRGGACIKPSSEASGASEAAEAADTSGRSETPETSSQSIAIDARFSALELLGEGGYGKIVGALDGRTGESVAIKRVCPTEDRLQLRCCLRELAILQWAGQHEHPNLLGLREVLRPAGGHHLAEWSCFDFVTERFEMDLAHVIKSDQPLDETHMRFFIWQLLRGVHALHAAGVLHRDLKPSNLLVNLNCELKIADYGISRGAHATGGGQPGADGPPGLVDGRVLPLLCSTPQVVTLWYRAPELLCGNRTYGSGIDLWSCGIIVAELLGRAPPFAASGHMGMLRLIVEALGTPRGHQLAHVEDAAAVRFLSRLPPSDGEDWADAYEDAPPAALGLLRRLLVWVPDERLTAAGALREPWLRPLHEEADLADDLARPPCAFPYEQPDLQLDHLLLAGLDAVRDAHPDYPIRVPEMLRFGTVHNRSVALGHADADADAREEGDALSWDAA